MAAFPTVRVAAVQATPVILDAAATRDKAAAAARTRPPTDGVQLAVLPESLHPAVPVERVGPGTRPASAAGTSCGSGCGTTRSMSPARCSIASSTVCRERKLYLRDRRQRARVRAARDAVQHARLHRPRRACSARHRKLMPTQHERLFHGVGAGDDLDVVELAGARGRRPDLLGEPDAARALRGVPRRARRSGSRRRPTTATAGSPRCATSRSSPAPSSSRCRSSSRPRRSPRTSPSRCPTGKEIFGRGGAA